MTSCRFYLFTRFFSPPFFVLLPFTPVHQHIYFEPPIPSFFTPIIFLIFLVPQKTLSTCRFLYLFLSFSSPHFFPSLPFTLLSTSIFTLYHPFLCFSSYLIFLFPVKIYYFVCFTPISSPHFPSAISTASITNSPLSSSLLTGTVGGAGGGGAGLAGR